VYDLDKKIWRELDDQEQTCEKLVKQIRKLRKEGVNLKSCNTNSPVNIDFLILNLHLISAKGALGLIRFQFKIKMHNPY